MSVLIDISGKQFGRLTVVRRAAGRNKNKNSRWLCLCQCGNSSVVESYNLRTGHVKSCGCLIPEATKEACFKHGLVHTSEYSIWGTMIQRCSNPKNVGWKNYGGRGIRVCKRWRNSFQMFYLDMGPKPFADATIERKDVNGNYEPSNCVWIHASEQGKNKRKTKRENP